MKITPLISLDEFLKIQSQANVLLFDASNGKDAYENYKKNHISGAQFVDLDSQLAAIKEDYSIGGRHPLPDIEKFAEVLQDLGISPDKQVIIYDDKNGANAAARFWWMLKSVGHDQVQVLNGGLQAAIKQQVPMRSGIERRQRTAGPYPVQGWGLTTIAMNDVEKIAQHPDYLVIDVRANERYAGTYEPIDLIAGHIPGAINIPFTENLDENGLFLDPIALKQKYESICSDFSPENLIVHCGSGVSACHTLLAFDYAGMPIPRLYVGSWSEWSRNIHFL